MPFFLSLLLVVSVFLRGSFVTVNPPELFGDEIDVGYQAYSLLKTGRDLYGQIFPAYIHSLSEWRAPLLIYATVPSVAVFGLTELGVRLPQVIFGSLAPLLLFLLVTVACRNRALAVFSALALALLPWHIHYSRVAFEVVILIDLILAGALLYWRKHFWGSALFFALAFYTYSTATLFVPALLAGLYFFTRRNSSALKPQLVHLIFLLVLLLPFVGRLITGQASGRFQLISVFNSGDLVDKIVLYRSQGGFLPALWHNKAEGVFHLVYDNYLRAFSSEFLFVRGDPVVRHNPQFIGQLLPLTAPLLLLGLFYLFSRRHYFWLFWLFLAPIPASLTVDGAFHATRLFLLVPPLAVAIGAGSAFLWDILSSRTRQLVLPAIWLALALQFVFVAHYYLVHYPAESWRWWHVGFKSIMRQIPDHSATFSRVFINNTYEPALIRFLFYTRFPPAEFHRQFTGDEPSPNIVSGYDGFALGSKYYFGSFSAEVKTKLEDYLLPDSLYLVSQRDDIPGDWDWRSSPPAGVRVIGASVDPGNHPLLYLVTRK